MNTNVLHEAYAATRVQQVKFSAHPQFGARSARAVHATFNDGPTAANREEHDGTAAELRPRVTWDVMRASPLRATAYAANRQAIRLQAIRRALTKCLWRA